MASYNDPSDNYGWILPDEAGDTGAWGELLNDVFGGTTGKGAAVDGIDAVVKAVSVVANAALPKAGGTMTGNLKILTEEYTISDLGSMSGATAVDLDVANYFYGTVGANITISHSNLPASGTLAFWIFEFTNPGAFTITWPATVDWPGGAEPDWTASGVDIIMLFTRDGGTTIHAARSSEDSS